jgi:hypothetical protein
MSRRVLLTPRHLVSFFALLFAVVQAAEVSADPSRVTFLVDTSGTYLRSDSGTQTPAVAFNGTTYLVAWSDKRDGQWNINAARVSPAGLVLDSADIPVCLAVGPQQHPAAASDGKGFLAAWEDQRSGMRWNVYAARLDSSGQVMDTAGILLRSLNGDKHSPAVAFGAGKYLVAWDEYYDSRNIVAAFVDTGGHVSNGIEVCAAPGSQGSSSVAFGDSMFVVAWDDVRDGSRSTIYAARITESGVLLDTNGFQVMTPHDAQALPSVAYDGTNFLVSWQEGPVLNCNILAARITPTGVVLDTAALCVSNAARDQSRPRAVFADSVYFITWEDERTGMSDAYCARVTPAGQLVDTAGIRVAVDSGPKLTPALAVGADQLLVSWQCGRNDSTPHGIDGSRISTSGVVLDSVSFLIGANLRKKYTRQDSASAVFGDSSWLVVWTDYRPDTLHTGIYSLRLARDGSPLDRAAIRVSSGDGDDRSPRAAFDGSNYLIVWTDSSSARCDIHGRRLSLSGVLLDTSDVPIASSGNREGSPAVVYDGSDFLVLWQELMSDGFHICGRRVSSEGVVLDTQRIIISVEPGGVSPAVASGDSWNLVVWRDSSGSSSEVEAVRVTHAGVVLDSPPTTLSYGLGRCRNPAVARAGEQYFVVWIDRPNSRDALLGVTLRWAGQHPETTRAAVYQGQPWPGPPAVAFNGRDYIVAWRWTDVKIAARGARVSQSGAVMEFFDVLAGNKDYYMGGLAAGPDSTMLVVFTTLTDSINGQRANCQRVWGLLSSLSGVAEGREPAALCRLECTPNPFTHSTVIRFLSRSARQVQVRIYDITGRAVRSLSTSSPDPTSLFATAWDGLDDSGRPIRPGCYFVRLVCDGIPVEAKLVRSH